MSAKLLYSLSDESQNQNLKKQIGCMNSLLQFFDPHHFINTRSIISSPSHRRAPQDETESKQQGKTVNSAGKKSKPLQGKRSNVVKEKQLSPIESSRFSVSSSTSTTISSSEYDWAPRPEHSPFAEPICNERSQTWDYQVYQPQTSPWQPSSLGKMSHYYHKHIRETSLTSASLIKSTPREGAIYELRHIDSPRLSHSSRPDSPRLSAPNESFRSISSNNSAPVMTPSKNRSWLSNDGRETMDNCMSTLKLRDLPRLSLDSKQRNMKDSVHVSRDDLLLQNCKRENIPQEPASCRTPSNIVAKLMGLEELPDYNPSSNSQREHVESHVMRSPDVFSRSSRALDASKVDRVLHSPRSNSKDTRVSRLDKAKSGQQEAKSESIKHPLTIYGAIEKRLADLDFQKSGKDLRALKQILESMHREKNKLENRTEYQSSQCTFKKNDSSSNHITQKQGPTKATPSKVKGLKSSREANLSKAVRDSKIEATHVVEDPTTRAQRLRIVQPIDGPKASVQKKTANYHKESHHIINKYSREKTPRSIRTSKSSEPITKASFTNSARISDRSSRVKHRLSQNQNQAPRTSILHESNDQSREFSNGSTCLNQQQNPRSPMSQAQVHDNKNQEVTQGEMAFEKLTIVVKEQPSPVSVLDANFYDDESPSPVKKKPTAFRDYKTNTTYTEPEWKDSPSYFADSVRTNFSYEAKDYQELESAPPILKLSTYQRENTWNNTPNYDEVDLEKSYVIEILSASGLLDDLDHKDDHLVHQSEKVINPKLFYELEQNRGSRFFPDNRGRHRRRLLFDAVSEILSEKLTQPRPLLKKQTGLKTHGPRLPQEILRELGQMQPICTPHNLDDEEDFLVTIIEKDLTQRSANWTDFSQAIPALVLDIERLIFKDLIVELVHDNTEAQVQKQSKQ